jgi:hypothetical protein
LSLSSSLVRALAWFNYRSAPPLSCSLEWLVQHWGELLLGIHIDLPRNEAEFYLWASLLIILYVVVNLASMLAKGRKRFEIPALVFDAVTFSSSVLLFIGCSISPTVLRLMGDTTWFLIAASLFGILYALQAAWRR